MIKEVVVSGKPHVTDEDLNKYRFISILQIGDTKQTHHVGIDFYKFFPITKQKMVASNVLTGYFMGNQSYGWYLGRILKMYYTKDEAYRIDSLGVLSKDELKTKINKSCEHAWKYHNQVRIMFVTADEDGQPKDIHVKIFNKDTPNKMQSKKMSAKKSPVKKTNILTKSCRKMTGDVRKMGKQLDKNLKKLI